MTQAERDVINAALAAVTVKEEGRVTVADITKNHEVLGQLIRAAVKLKHERGVGHYWKET